MLNEVDIDPTYCYSHPLTLYGGSVGFLVLFDAYFLHFLSECHRKIFEIFKVQSTLISR